MTVSRIATEQERLTAQLEPSLGRLAARGIVRSYRKNSIVLNEGEPGDSLFVLLQGQVKVYATDENGREITYGTIQAGDYFGEMSLDGGPRSASVMTMENCLCSLVSRTAVQQHLADEPAFALSLVTQVIHRARSATETARRQLLLQRDGLDAEFHIAALLEVFQQPADHLAGRAHPAGNLLVGDLRELH